jgi:hypothetical protein
MSVFICLVLSVPRSVPVCTAVGISIYRFIMYPGPEEDAWKLKKKANKYQITLFMIKFSHERPER